MADEETVTCDLVRETLNYDPSTGEFTWKTSSGRARAGSVAGTQGTPRCEIRVCGRRYMAHRLAWLYVHGEWPPFEIDHENRDQRDNRISNLRPATHSQNGLNRGDVKTIAPAGVGWYPRTQRWRVRIKVDQKEIALGYFKRLVDAIGARRAAESRYFPDFQRFYG